MQRLMEQAMFIIVASSGSSFHYSCVLIRIAENLDCHLRETCFTATCIRNKRSSSEIIRAARKAKAVGKLQDLLFTIWRNFLFTYTMFFLLQNSGFRIFATVFS